MNTTRAIAGAMLWLALAAKLGVLARAQDAPQSPQGGVSPAESLWYGADPSSPVEQVTAGLAPWDAGSPFARVYGYAEGLVLQRSNGSFDQPIIVETIDGNQGATFLSTSDLNFEVNPALRVTLGFRLHDNWALEGSYLGVCESEASNFLTTPPDTNLTFPGGLVTNVISGVDRIWTDYSSSFCSAELNLVCGHGGCTTSGDLHTDYGVPGHGAGSRLRCQTFEWLAGFRYLSLSEELNIHGERDQEIPQVTTAVEHGPYNIRTGNDLYGGQVGARLRRWGERLGWEATSKAGIFGNDAQEEQYIIDFPNFELRPLTGDAGVQVAFAGELNLTAIYRLSDVWNLRAGYNLIWISGLALAPDQLDFSGTLPAGDLLHSTGSMFLHGASCGVEARW